MMSFWCHIYGLIRVGKNCIFFLFLKQKGEVAWRKWRSATTVVASLWRRATYLDVVTYSRHSTVDGWGRLFSFCPRGVMCVRVTSVCCSSWHNQLRMWWCDVLAVIRHFHPPSRSPMDAEFVIGSSSTPSFLVSSELPVWVLCLCVLSKG